MDVITCKPFFHNSMEQVAICFNSNKVLNQYVKQISHAKWSQTNKCWYIPMTKQHCSFACKILSPFSTISDANLHELDKMVKTLQLKAYSIHFFVISDSTTVERSLRRSVHRQEFLSAFKCYSEPLRLFNHYLMMISPWLNCGKILV